MKYRDPKLTHISLLFGTAERLRSSVTEQDCGEENKGKINSRWRARTIISPHVANRRQGNSHHRLSMKSPLMVMPLPQPAPHVNWQTLQSSVIMLAQPSAWAMVSATAGSVQQVPEALNSALTFCSSSVPGTPICPLAVYIDALQRQASRVSHQGK